VRGRTRSVGLLLKVDCVSRYYLILMGMDRDGQCRQGRSEVAATPPHPGRCMPSERAADVTVHRHHCHCRDGAVPSVAVHEDLALIEALERPDGTGIRPRAASCKLGNVSSPAVRRPLASDRRVGAALVGSYRKELAHPRSHISRTA
jgi:hypothetical protein